MVKGFKDGTGKFHPISQTKGVRSRRDTSQKTQGVLRKERSGHKCYFCNSKDTQYCGMCGEYMCQKHMKNYPKRLEGMVTKARMKRYRKKLLEMTPTELQSFEIIADVEDNFQKILKRTAKRKGCFLGGDGNLNRPEGFAERTGQRSGQVEEFCGAVTEEIENLIFKKYGKSVGVAEQGHYTGEGVENSVDYDKVNKEVTHEWFRLADGTIIDGAGGQFVDERRTVRNEDRLRIITCDDPRQKWYEPYEAVGKGKLETKIKLCPICAGGLTRGKCPSTDVHRAMELVKQGVPAQEARRRVGLR
ncbi:MAG: hypothetical protein KJI69_03735 [Patescibacteria group bacterium]|nr:hypothetical protein [Patescibacteria group bacterium]